MLRREDEIRVLPSGNVEWEFPDLDRYQELDWSYSIWSSSFHFGGEKWSLWIKKDLLKKDVQMMGLRLDSTGSSLVPVKFSFAVKGYKDTEKQGMAVFEKGSTPHSIKKWISRTEYERRKSEWLVSGRLTIVCTIKILNGTFLSAELISEFEQQREKYEEARSMLDKTLKEKDDISKDLEALVASIEELLKNKLKLEEVTTEKLEFCFGELGSLKEKYESAQSVLERTAKEKEDIRKELDASKAVNKILLKEKVDLEADLKAARENLVNSQLKEQLLAISQELEVERNRRELLESEILMMEKKICELQSVAQDNIGLNSEDETKEKDLPKVYDIVADINCLLEEEKGLDVTFLLDGDTEVVAHKLVLTARSSFFADKLYSKDRSQERKTIPLKGVDPKAFKKMIRYCYDCEPGLKTTEEACALLKVSFEFQVMSLVNVCSAFLKQTEIETKNVFKVFEVSEKMGDKSLTDRCLKVLEEKTENIMASCELRDVTPLDVQRILMLPKLSLRSEYELILWVSDWAKLKSEDEDLNNKSARDYLENLLPYINFLALTCEEFAKFCKHHPNFFFPEEVASLSLNIMIPGTREMPEWYNKDLRHRVYTGCKG